jgi:hypothetical protein
LTYIKINFPRSLEKLSKNKDKFLPKSGKIFLKIRNIKGCVHRKLRWVKNGVNRWVGASEYGAGHYFVNLV